MYRHAGSLFGPGSMLRFVVEAGLSESPTTHTVSGPQKISFVEQFPPKDPPLFYFNGEPVEGVVTSSGDGAILEFHPDLFE